MNLKECYAAMGEDYEDIMAHLPRESSVIKFLRKFKDNDEFEKMLDAVEREDYKEIFTTTHNLKGMSANLSLKKLSGITSEICELVRNGEPAEDIGPLVEIAKNEYINVTSAVELLED